jgi:cytochrome c oxidase cbb3-type subunit 4
MSALWGNVVGIVIVILMFAFIGIWYWAWRPLHKKAFDSMAQIPMEDPLEGVGGPTGESLIKPRNRVATRDEDTTR